MAETYEQLSAKVAPLHIQAEKLEERRRGHEYEDAEIEREWLALRNEIERTILELLRFDLKALDDFDFYLSICYWGFGLILSAGWVASAFEVPGSTIPERVGTWDEPSKCFDCSGDIWIRFENRSQMRRDIGKPHACPLCFEARFNMKMGTRIDPDPTAKVNES